MVGCPSLGVCLVYPPAAFVNKGVVVSLEAWGGGPLALLLRVGKVGVFPQILTSGGERG